MTLGKHIMVKVEEATEEQTDTRRIEPPGGVLEVEDWQTIVEYRKTQIKNAQNHLRQCWE
jgi:hypothetical protein